MSDVWANCMVDGAATLNCVPALLGYLISLAMTLAGIVAVFFIVWGGFKFVTSGGDPKQLDGARKTITYAIIGLIVVLMAYVILSFISTVTGVSCIKIFGFTNCKATTTADSITGGDTGASGDLDTGTGI